MPIPSFQNAPSSGGRDEPRVNTQITSAQVRLILSTGENFGIIPTREAIRRAADEGLDLIEISSGEFPVCKIMDAGKYRYELQKRTKEQKKKQKTIDIKEIKFTPNIGANDYQVKVRHAREFLEDGDKVRFTLRFRGREMSYIDLGMAVLRRAQADLDDIAKVEFAPKMEGRQMGMLVAPKA
ncbi:MAG: translation initiation factor IF-3 [Alphaproteobacteria bacterium]|nr:translation initiation factor IF-3 [Alphaproteobacteria bacterium]